MRKADPYGMFYHFQRKVVDKNIHCCYLWPVAEVFRQTLRFYKKGDFTKRQSMDWKRKVIAASFAFFLFFTAFSPGDDSSQRIDMGKIENDLLSEASGLAASAKNPGVLWIHNDSGDTNRIFAMSITGRHLGIYYLDDMKARDWEDIAVAPGPVKGKSYLYLADTGDNDAKHLMKRIYRFEEPKVDTSQTAVDTVLASIDVITFQYPDGKRDAEGLMVDPLSADIYIVSKREQQSRLYRMPFP